MHVREAAKRDLIKAGGRKEVAMMAKAAVTANVRPAMSGHGDASRSGSPSCRLGLRSDSAKEVPRRDGLAPRQNDPVPRGLLH